MGRTAERPTGAVVVDDEVVEENVGAEGQEEKGGAEADVDERVGDVAVVEAQPVEQRVAVCLCLGGHGAEGKSRGAHGQDTLTVL